jgi:hypothetical protein
VIVIAANPYRGAARPRARVEALIGALAVAGLRAPAVWEPHQRAAGGTVGRGGMIGPHSARLTGET